MTAPAQQPDRKTGWLDSRRNADKIYWGVIALCALLFLADSFYDKHPKFDAEYLFGFYGVFGFVACLLLVVTARGLRRLLGRNEDYYGSATDDRKDSSR